MKLKFKKFLFLINDISALLLQKNVYQEKLRAEEKLVLYKKLFIVILLLFLISLLINLILIF